MDREDFIEMRVGGLTLDPVTKTPVVILKDAENKLTLPIWIGLMEATAMATELEGIKMARPMTHDLLRNLIADLGGVVEFVEVTDLRDNTYYATITSRDTKMGQPVRSAREIASLGRASRACLRPPTRSSISA